VTVMALSLDKSRVEGNVAALVSRRGDDAAFLGSEFAPMPTAWAVPQYPVAKLAESARFANWHGS